ncbi:putative transcription factor WRKY family [Helianthus annuus]|nr:putative transcription factor WRKY family [Helianthus annuus]KAJ0752416.1 putative transcription factor WRKY family [Helianthus annuus]
MIIYQEHNFASSCKPNFKMSGDDPMSKSYSYRSIDSPDIEYDVPNQQNSEFFDDLLVFHDWSNEDQPPIVPEYQDYNPVYAAAAIDDHGSQSSIGTSSSHLQGNSSGGNGVGQAQRVTKEKIAFKTKSQVEILDDGFKWRKYGKKMVKNSPNPRNYYRCSADGCSVKKRVERDVEDARYVITTYEGIHNHQRPSNS